MLLYSLKKKAYNKSYFFETLFPSYACDATSAHIKLFYNFILIRSLLHSLAHSLFLRSLCVSRFNLSPFVGCGGLFLPPSYYRRPCVIYINWMTFLLLSSIFYFMSKNCRRKMRGRFSGYSLLLHNCH